mgnify:CR=1 FL=1
MKIIYFLLLLFCTAEGAVFTGNRRSSFSELKNSFFSPDAVYAPFLFWFWDGPLDQESERLRLAQMADKMIEQHLNPGYVHARFNMVGLPDLPREQWLSPLWFDTFARVLEQTAPKEHYVGLCGDFWWPTGQAAGRVLERHPDLWAVSLRWETIDVPSGERVEIPPTFFAVAVRIIESHPLQELKFELAAPAAGNDVERQVMPHRPVTISSQSIRLISDGGPTSWRAPSKGTWRVYCFHRYFHPGCDGGRVNYLDRRLADAFIQEALRPTVEPLGHFFGKTIPGVFFDHEGDYGYKLAYSEDLAEHLRRRTGRDLRLALPLLLDDDREGRSVSVRWNWFDCVSDVYTDYFRAINDWCAAHNLWAVSNLWEEHIQWQASAVGDFFKAQRAFSLPGTDALGLRALEPHDFMETRSVCEFEGRRQQCEIMGAAGLWGFTPVTIKQVANAVIGWGVSHVTAHAAYATRRLEGNPWLPDWFDEHPWWPWLHTWSDFVGRASLINSYGHSAADVLLLNPMDSVWGLSNSRVFDPAFPDRVPVPEIMPPPSAADVAQSSEEMKQLSAWWLPPRMHEWFDDRVWRINQLYSQTIDELVSVRAEFLVTDRYYLQQMSVERGQLVRPPFRFHTVFMPATAVLTLNSARKLVEFAESGGRVMVIDQTPRASAERGRGDPRLERLMRRLLRQPTVHFIPGDSLKAFFSREGATWAHVDFLDGAFPMHQQHRRIEGRDFFWLINNTDQRQTARLLFPNIRGTARLWDCETGQIRPLACHAHQHGSVAEVQFGPYEAYWVMFEDGEPHALTAVSEEKLLLTLDHEWTIRIDPEEQPPVEHPFDRSLLDQPMTRRVHLRPWQEYGLPTFSGRVQYETTFLLEPAGGRTVIDLGQVFWSAEVILNGKSLGGRLWPPFRFDATDALQEGENLLQITVGNLLNNCCGDLRPAGLLGPVSLILNQEP